MRSAGTRAQDSGWAPGLRGRHLRAFGTRGPSSGHGTGEAWGRRAASLSQEGGKEACPEGSSAWESPPLRLFKWLVEEGQTIIFLKSSHWLQESSKGRLMGPARRLPQRLWPQPVLTWGGLVQLPWLCLGPRPATPQGQLGTGRTEREGPQESPAERKEGKVHIGSKVCVHYCWRNQPPLEEPALGKSANAAR